MTNEPTFRLATAQLHSPTDPRDTAAIRRAGADARRLMSAASAAGAQLIHFGEGTLCAPNKRLLSSDPDTVAAADWTRFDWTTQRGELEQIARHAAELQLWTVIGAVHRLTVPHRPVNSLYVIDDRGLIVTRYDERMLSHTKISFLYSPGTDAVVFDVEGMRFGCTLGMETQYPEIFAEYERAGVHCVLSSTMDNGTTFSLQARSHASTNSFWVSYATTSTDASAAPSGVADPSGAWVRQCPGADVADVVVTDLDREHEPLARPWRRWARSEAYAGAIVVDDPRVASTTF